MSQKLNLYKYQLQLSVEAESTQDFLQAYQHYGLLMIEDYADEPELDTFSNCHMIDLMQKALKNSKDVASTLRFIINVSLNRFPEIIVLLTENYQLHALRENWNTYPVLFDTALFKKVASEHLLLTGEMFGTQKIDGKEHSLLDYALNSDYPEIIEYYQDYPEFLKDYLSHCPVQNEFTDKIRLDLSLDHPARGRPNKV